MVDRGSELGRLQRKVADAEHAQVRRVVARVDAMTSRGEADHLIASLRPRLGHLQVVRPLRLPRLLFVPLDPLLVTPVNWRFGDHTLPRSVILPMTRIVEATLADKAAAIRRAIQNRTTADIELIGSIGVTLWSEAAAALDSATLPARWTETGLADALFRELAAQLAALLRQAPALDRLVIETANGMMPPDRHGIEAMVRAVTQERADALPMLAILLVSRLPRAAGVLYDLAARRSLLGLAPAIEQAVSVLLDRLGQGSVLVANKGLPALVASAQRVATLLDELDHEQAPRARREQIRELRQRLDRDCQAHFRTGLRTEFVAPLQACASGGEADIRGLEQAARGLRMLEAEGRSIGAAAAYQEMLAEAVRLLEDLPSAETVSMIDRVRLMEILAGAEKALALLDGAPVSDRP